MMYAITAQRITTRDGWRSSIGVPTFFLDSMVQGLIDVHHAARFASRMLHELAPADRCIGTVTDDKGTVYATFDTRKDERR